MAADWYCLIDGTVVGPIDGNELKRMAESGRLRPGDSVRKTESGRWASAIQVKGLTFKAGLPPPAPPKRISTSPDNEGIQQELDPAPPTRRERDRRDYDEPVDDDDDDESDADDDDDEDYPRSRKRRRIKKRDVSGLVMAPAIALLITAVLGVLINLFQIVIVFAAPQFLQQNPFGQDAPPALSAAFGVIFALVSAVIAAGAASMMRIRTYPLSMTSAILSMLNISNCCCVLGLPFGIWALIILCREDVKAAFRANEGRRR
jgi:hypothetical protein